MGNAFWQHTMVEAAPHTYLVNVEDFVEKMFPIKEEDVGKIFDQLKNNNAYGDDGWINKPGDRALEAEYEAMFVTCAEAIRLAYITLHPNLQPKILTQWLRFSSRSPKSFNEFASLIRPNIVLSILAKSEQDRLCKTWKHIQELEEELAEDPNDKDKIEQLKDLVATLRIFWGRVNVVVEIKQELEEGSADPTIQLLTYLGQVLREQVDRRSTFGLLLCANELAIWYIDRSGAVGTRATFNIHENPRLFIKIILACSFCDPEHLGWDTSMRLWLGKKDRSLHSFDPDVPPACYEKPKRRWVVEMPTHYDEDSPSPSNGPTTKTPYLTIEAISISRAEMVFGRATYVWVVMRLEDIDKDDHNVFVLKQSWRPLEARKEAELTPKMCWVNKVLSSEDVSYGDSIVDTPTYLRRGLASNFASSSGANPEALPPMYRVQTRILTKDYGWPIKDFADLNELLSTLESCVRAQQLIYHKNGILQRDVSLGNIIICPSDGKLVANTSARLIDFDYAKEAEYMSPSLLGQSAALPQPTPDEETKLTDDLSFLQTIATRPIPIELWRVLGLCSTTMISYLRSLKTIDDLSEGMASAAEHLKFGFLSEQEMFPEFRVSKAHMRERTGTAPFISAEILSGERMFQVGQPKPIFLKHPNGSVTKNQWLDHLQSGTDWRLIAHEPGHSGNDFKDDPMEPVCHDAIHDLESLHHVVTYICLAQEGPGGDLRLELRPGTDLDEVTDETIALRRVYHDLFVEDNVNTLASTKAGMFRRGSYPSEVSVHFHPYFQPLKPMMDQWWRVLVMAHKWPIFEASFEYVLAAILGGHHSIYVNPSDPQYAQRTQEVISRRSETIQYLRNFPSSDGRLTYNGPLIESEPIQTQDRPESGSGNVDQRSDSPSETPAKRRKLAN